jgi:hypothetical protein
LGGQGFQPLAHFPPLYPLLLAIAASSIQEAAKVQPLYPGGKSSLLMLKSSTCAEK